MDIELQKTLIEIATNSREVMSLTSHMLKPSYFDPSLRKTVAFVLDFFNTHRDVPKPAIVKAKTGMDISTIDGISKADVEYVTGELAGFCQERAVTEAILKGPELLDKGNFGEIITTLRAAISVGLKQDIGTNYFENPEERLRKTLIDEPKISTGWEELDEMLGGGIGEEELIVFLANSGGGKSMTKLNLAHNWLRAGLNGIYITLEMAERVVTKRLDSMVTEVSQANLARELELVADKIVKASGTMGKFFVKRMPENGTNINHVRAYLQELEQATGFKPDFIVIDYIDIMGTTQNIDVSNLFVKDKFVTEEIRSLGHEFKCRVISSAQLGRNAIEAEKLHQGHIQGGMSKINTADYVVAIKQDDIMKAAGEISFEILKSRNSAGVGSRAILGWDPVSLRVKSRAKSALSLSRKKPSPVLNTSGTVFNKKDDDNDVLKLLNQ